MNFNSWPKSYLPAPSRKTLSTLSWHVHPPTSLTAVKHFMLLLPEDACHFSIFHEIKELSRFLTELSVCDYFFVKQKATTIGLAALMSSIELIDGNWKPGAIELFMKQVVIVAGCDPQCSDVLECKARLQETYIQGGFYDQQQIAGKNTQSQRGGISPVCVSNVPV